MKRIYLIDCPGIVPPSQNDTDEELLLRGSVRVENIELASQYIPAILRRVQAKHLQRTYEIPVDEETDATTFLEQLARKSGRLIKGGEADLDGCAKIVLNDWIRGKIPWFTPPPKKGSEEEGVRGVEGREGRLGEMPSKKRKRDDESEATRSVTAAAEQTTAAEIDEVDPENGDDDEFEGFSEDEGGLEIDMDDDDSVEDEDDDNDDDNDEDKEGAESSISPKGDVSEDENDVEEEVLAISKALASAKKGVKGT